MTGQMHLYNRSTTHAAFWFRAWTSMFVLLSISCADRAKPPARNTPSPEAVPAASQNSSEHRDESAKPPPPVPATVARPSSVRIVRVGGIDFPVEGAVESAGRLLLMSPDGRVQIRGGNGQVEHALDAALTPLRQAAPVPEGWIVIGSSRQDVDGNETGAAVLVKFDGSTGPLRRAPGVLISVASNGAAIVATDVTGGAYILREDGSFEPIALPAEVRGAPVRAVFWGDEPAFCRGGIRRPGKDPRSVCVTADGDRVDEVWRDPPIACGSYLVANVQASGMMTSPWRRVVWSAAQGGSKKVAEQDLPHSPPAPSCFRTWLAETEGPGQLLELPSATVVRAPLCERASDMVVAGEEAIWCLRLAGAR
jgi:hypothetical protein